MTSTLVGDGNCPSSSGRLSGVWLDQVTYQPHTWPLILIHSPLTPFHSFLTSSFLQGATLVVALYVETNPLFSPVLNIFHLCPSSDLVFIYTVSLKNLLLPSTSLPYLEICLLHHTISLQTSPHYIRGDSPIEANYNFLTQQACQATSEIESSVCPLGYSPNFAELVDKELPFQTRHLSQLTYKISISLIFCHCRIFSYILFHLFYFHLITFT